MTVNVHGISGEVTRVLGFALTALDARQRAIASNLANIETPNYLAREVQFEDSLRAALKHDDLAQAEFAVEQSQAPTRLNGNNVSIDFETLASAENLLRQKLLVQALNSKFNLMRASISG